MTATTDAAKSADSPEWMRRKERGNMFWLRVMSWLSMTLGRRVSRTVVLGIALYFLLAASAARKASRTYLALALGRPATWLDLYRHFLAFASTIHDRVYLINGRHELFDIRVHGAEPLHALHAGRRGFFLFGGHLGSFEVLRALARDQPQMKLSMAMYPENARQINDALSAINPRVMQDIIVLGKLNAILAIHDKLQEGAMVGVLADRSAGPDQYLTLPFLGAPAGFPSGPVRMAAVLRHPVYFMAGVYGGGNRYDVHFELLADFSTASSQGRDAAVREVLTRYAAALERHCKSSPYNWFNFYDFWAARTSDTISP
jgi:predicted LPLAT superfamily acyltransferase